MEGYVRDPAEGVLDLTARILRHPLSDKLTEVGEYVAWRNKEGKVIPYPGLTTRIKDRFIPSQFRYKKGHSSRDRGSAIHRQLYHAIECKKKCRCHVKTRTFGELAQLGFRVLRAAHLEPIAAEVPILSHPAHVGTRLDMICKDDRSGAEVIISVKTGIPDGSVTGLKLNAPFSDLDCNGYNIAQMQSCGELAILERDYGIKCTGYYLLCLYKKGKNHVVLQKLMPWVMQRTDEWYGVMGERKGKKRKKE